jgi:hypothetical protein
VWAGASAPAGRTTPHGRGFPLGSEKCLDGLRRRVYSYLYDRDYRLNTMPETILGWPIMLAQSNVGTPALARGWWCRLVHQLCKAAGRGRTPLLNSPPERDFMARHLRPHRRRAHRSPKRPRSAKSGLRKQRVGRGLGSSENRGDLSYYSYRLADLTLILARDPNCLSPPVHTGDESPGDVDGRSRSVRAAPSLA